MCPPPPQHTDTVPVGGEEGDTQENEPLSVGSGAKPRQARPKARGTQNNCSALSVNCLLKKKTQLEPF